MINHVTDKDLEDLGFTQIGELLGYYYKGCFIVRLYGNFDTVFFSGYSLQYNRLNIRIL